MSRARELSRLGDTDILGIQTGDLRVGSIAAGTKLNVASNVRAGIVTATQYFGDGSGLTGLVAVSGIGITILDDNLSKGAVTQLNFGDFFTVSTPNAGLATVTVGVATGVILAQSAVIQGITTTATLNVTQNANVGGVSTFTGNVSFGSSAFFGDNDKLFFGDGNDLQIYHDGSNSYIDDAATGDLYIRSNALRLQKYTGETTAVFVSDGAAELYYDNTKEFETTGFGATVFGILQSQGLRSTGISTLSTTTFIGSGSSTGTASQTLQVTGGAYVSDNIGIGSTRPTSKLHVIGDVLITGVVTASSYTGNLSSSGFASTAGIATTAINAQGLIGTPNISVGFATATKVTTTDVVSTHANFSGVTTVTNLTNTHSNTTGVSTVNSLFATSAQSSTNVTVTGFTTIGRGGVNAVGVVTSVGGFISVGNTSAVKISLIANEITFTVPGIGSTTLILY